MPPDKYSALKELTNAINRNRDKKVRFILTTMNDAYSDEPVCIVAVVVDEDDDEDLVLPPEDRATADGG